MTDYTPTTEEIRAWLIAPGFAGGTDNEELGKKFDRWLSEVLAVSWEEGQEAGYDDALSEQRGIGPHIPARNQYRAAALGLTAGQKGEAS